MRAQVRLKLDEVRELRDNLILPALAGAITAKFNGLVGTAMRRLVEVAPKVAGLPAGLALPLLREGSDDCLVWYQNTLPGWMAENAPEHLPESEPDLEL